MDDLEDRLRKRAANFVDVDRGLWQQAADRIGALREENEYLKLQLEQAQNLLREFQ